MSPDGPSPCPDDQAAPEEASANDGTLIAGLDIGTVTLGILRDLDLLRAGKISVGDARARAELARQALRAISFAIQAHRLLAGAARDVTSLEAPTSKERDDGCP